METISLHAGASALGAEGTPLAARLARVAHLVATIDGAYWPNQYANALNPQAHAMGTMAEIGSGPERC